MSNYAAIKTALTAAVSAVSSTGVVYPRKRWAPDWKSFIEVFRDPDDHDRINGWCVSRMASPETYLQNRESERKHRFLIRGYYGLCDADDTETIFDGIVEDVCDALRGNYDLGGACEMLYAPTTLKIEERRFGSILCHVADIQIEAQERLPWS